MAEAAVGAAIQVLLEQLLTLSQEQISLIRNFKNDLVKLKDSLDMVKAFLHDAETKQVTSEAVKIWLRDLEALAFEADNVLDEFNYQLLSKQVGPTTRNKTVMKKAQSFFSCSNNKIAYRHKLGRRIKGVNQKLESINQKAVGFGLQNIAVQASVCGSPSRETDPFAVDPIILGRENDVSIIVDKLITTTPSPAEQVLSVLPIVGMGGLGKTTLARKVFHHEKMISHFGDNRVWVYVSRKFDVCKILKNILTSFTKEKFELDTRAALLQKLQDHLRTKRYLLVLDDVWNEDREMWDGFVNSLKGISSATGSCMVVTTRGEKIASIVETLPVHELQNLSKDDCWSIIKAKAFRVGDNPSEFEAIGNSIAEKCGGLPLAAKVVGGLLGGKSKDEWQEIEMNWLSDFGDDRNPISKILKLSFDNLPSPSLKKCFAYCSIFPKGYKIEKEILIELWMAEGFLQTDRQRSNVNMETTGNTFFNLLLQSSLLQVVERDIYLNVTHCNMHDLVHDLACSLTDGICQSRYIGYKSSGDGFLSIPKGQERYVRTLFFNGKVSDITFSNFESLHSLTLVSEDYIDVLTHFFNLVSEDYIDVLPTSIRMLKHLRYLDISYTSITFLPDSIGELYHLLTLRAELWNLEKLPDSLSNLISLRHLHIFFNTALPLEIGKLTSLQTLPYFHVGGEKGCRISELGNLKDLKGKLEILNLEKVRDKDEAMSADLLRKSSICKLKLVWDESSEGEANDESVLEGLQPHPNLKGLEIFGFNGKRLPLWTSKMAVQLDGHRWEGLNNLMKIVLENCRECEELPMLGHLPHLKSLCLDGLKNVKYIGTSFYGIDKCRKSGINNSYNGVYERDTIVVFPALEELVLRDMPNLIEWAQVDLPLPSLKYLRIIKCRQLTRAPIHFPCLEKLEIDEMESSLALENICGTKLTSLTHLSISEVKGLGCLPYWIFSNNHNLTKLQICHCPNMTHLVPCLGGGGAPSLLRELVIRDCTSLRELPDDLHSLNSLEKLEIFWCLDLKSIPYPISSGGGGNESIQGFTSLRHLCIRGCKGLTNLPIAMVESCAPSLETLTLEGLSNVTNLGMVIGCLDLHKMTRLREFSICDNVYRLTGSNSLKHLDMGPWKNNVSFNEAVDAMLHHFISLRRLTLTGKEHWDCLPDQLQHLTSLEELQLWDFGIEALPEWFGNLSSLETLRLSDCGMLRHFPSKQAMQRLSKLSLVYIRRCPLLLSKEKKRSNNNNDDELPQIDDSQWPKISHIPNIKVDGHQISSDRNGH